MSRHSKSQQRLDSGLVEIKTKFDAEFRRFSLSRNPNTPITYDQFSELLEKLHKLSHVPFLISYTDPRDGDLLPINNDDNLWRALQSARPLLRVIVQRKGDSLEELNGYGTFKPKNIISSILGGAPNRSKPLAISNPHDFRQVSSIIDVDIVPETCRRVRLVKHGTERPLGFYIRDGTSFRVTPSGVQKVPGIFISRLVPGGLAESTGLLAVNDEVLEVNGIEVAGKSLDQVTDMMVANSWNLIMTVRPANMRGTASNAIEPSLPFPATTTATSPSTTTTTTTTGGSGGSTSSSAAAAAAAAAAAITNASSSLPPQSTSSASSSRRHSASVESNSSGESGRLDAEGDTVVDHLSGLELKN